MIRFKIDVMNELKKAGYNTTKIRNERIFSEATLTKIRNNGNVTLSTVDTICNILKKQPGSILEWTPDTEND